MNILPTGVTVNKENTWTSYLLVQAGETITERPSTIGADKSVFKVGIDMVDFSNANKPVKFSLKNWFKKIR